MCAFTGPSAMRLCAGREVCHLGASAALELAYHITARGLHTICGPGSGMRRPRPIVRIAAGENVGRMS
jgi:hypothetical protein